MSRKFIWKLRFFSLVVCILILFCVCVNVRIREKINSSIFILDFLLLFYFVGGTKIAFLMKPWPLTIFFMKKIFLEMKNDLWNSSYAELILCHSRYFQFENFYSKTFFTSSPSFKCFKYCVRRFLFIFVIIKISLPKIFSRVMSKKKLVTRF